MKKIPEELNFLIGKKLKHNIKETSIVISGREYKDKFLTIDKEERENLINDLKDMGYETIRFMKRGGIYTQDIRMDRLCLKVNDDGVIESIYFG